MSIDDKVENVGPMCFHNGIYHYRTSKDKNGKQYCVLSENRCPYYKRVGDVEYCLSYNTGEKTK